MARRKMAINTQQETYELLVFKLKNIRKCGYCWNCESNRWWAKDLSHMFRARDHFKLGQTGPYEKGRILKIFITYLDKSCCIQLIIGKWRQILELSILSNVMCNVSYTHLFLVLSTRYVIHTSIWCEIYVMNN